MFNNAALCQETHADYASTLRLLQSLEAVVGEPLKDELFAYSVSGLFCGLRDDSKPRKSQGGSEDRLGS
jgi:hypothetical protein